MAISPTVDTSFEVIANNNAHININFAYKGL